MQEKYPDKSDKTSANGGIAAHWLGSTVLTGRLPIKQFIGKSAPNGVVITSEIIEYVQIYVKHVLSLKAPVLHLESEVTADSIHPELWGTVDCWCDYESRGVEVIDYKYGWGIVEPFENWQLICYAAGVLDKLGVDGVQDQELPVKLTIVQPRPHHRDGPIRSWQIKASDLRGYFNMLRDSAEEALSIAPVMNVGPHCKYCSARYTCSMAQKASYEAMELSEKMGSIALTPEEMGSDIKVLRRAKEAIDHRLSGLEIEAMSQISSGKHVPGWRIEQGYGWKNWTKPMKEVFAIGDLCGVNLRKETAITPTQAIKVGVSKELVNAFSDAAKTKLKLVPDNGTKAKEVFK
jgi:hypothetical protein